MADQIRVYDGEDFRFYKEKWFTIQPLEQLTDPRGGVTVHAEDGTFIGFITGRRLLEMAMRRV
jgi:hypothetical protein